MKPLGYDEQHAVVATAQTVGYRAILDLLRYKIVGIEGEMSVYQETRDEDLRLLQKWRGYKEALMYMEQLPQIIEQQLTRDAQTGSEGAKFMGMEQPSLFGAADYGDIYGVADQLRPQFMPTEPPPHPNNFPFG